MNIGNFHSLRAYPLVVHKPQSSLCVGRAPCGTSATIDSPRIRQPGRGENATVKWPGLRISWAEKKTNVNVLREGNVQRSLLKTIRKRQMEFLGHVCRRRGLEFLSLTGKVEGKRDLMKQRFLDRTRQQVLMTEMFGWSPMSVPDLAPDDDDDIYMYSILITKGSQVHFTIVSV